MRGFVPAMLAALLAAAGCDDPPAGDPLVVWAARAGGEGLDRALGAAVDGSGAIYVTGQIEGALLSRYSAAGRLEWVAGAGDAGADGGHSVAVAPDGTVYAVGARANGTLFLARFAPDGQLVWERDTAGTWATQEGCYRASAVALTDDSVAIKGTFAGTAVFGAGEPGETELVALGPRDDFAARYDAEGGLVWARRLGGTGGAGGLTELADGRLALGGDFEWTVVLGAGEPGETELGAAGLRDIYVAVLEPGGDLVWAERAGSSGWESATGVAALADGSFLVTGYFMSAIAFDPDESSEIGLVSEGSDTSFVVRYDAGGGAVSALAIGGGGWVDACSIATLPGGGFAVAGWLDDLAPAVIGDGASQVAIESTGQRDALVAIFDDRWALTHAIGLGSSGPAHVDDRAYVVAAGADGSLAMAGSFEGQALVIDRARAGSIELLNTGGSDAFVARLEP